MCYLFSSSWEELEPHNAEHQSPHCTHTKNSNHTMLSTNHRTVRTPRTRTTQCWAPITALYAHQELEPHNAEHQSPHCTHTKNSNHTMLSTNHRTVRTPRTRTTQCWAPITALYAHQELEPHNAEHQSPHCTHTLGLFTCDVPFIRSVVPYRNGKGNRLTF